MGEYAKWTGDVCRSKMAALAGGMVAIGSNELLGHASAIRADTLPGGETQRPLQLVSISADDTISDVYEGDPPQSTTVIELETRTFSRSFTAANRS